MADETTLDIQSQTKYGRRDFLKKVGALGTVTVLSFIEGGCAPPGSLDNVNEIFDGEIKIKKGVNIRTSPTVPINNEVPNVISWDEVKEINGLAYQGQEDIIIENAPIVRGYDPETHFGDSGRWIKLSVKTSSGDKDVFINISSQTAEFVRPDYANPVEQNSRGRFLEINSRENGTVKAKYSSTMQDSYERTFSHKQVGIIKVPQASK